MRNEFIGAIAIALFVMVPSGLAEDQVVLSSGVTLRGLILDHRSDDFAIKLRTELGEVPILRSAIHAVEQDADLESRYQLAARMRSN